MNLSSCSKSVFFKSYFFLSALLAILSSTTYAQSAGTVSGELKKWHKVTLSFNGPTLSESGNGASNPFTDYRLNVTFSNGSESFVVPGYFAADGNAAVTHATSGNVWRVHFTPDATGTWNYKVSFRKGTMIATSTDATSGVSAGYFDGAAGSFLIAASDKPLTDLRTKGRLKYNGTRYYQFADSQESFLKIGADSPESTLANPDIDGSTSGYRSTFEFHGVDWKTGDPTWGDGTKGKNLIGAINYLSSKGVNAMYLMLLTAHGDTKSVWPYVSTDDYSHFDCSKLDQWEIVFNHVQNKGMMNHFVLTETENESYWEYNSWKKTNPTATTFPTTYGTTFDDYRKIYYREYIARFGHHLAIVWNLGEEIGTNTSNDTQGWGAKTTADQRAAFAQFIRQVDPYKSPIVAHTTPGTTYTIYNSFLGKSYFEGPSMQLTLARYGMSGANGKTYNWITNSLAHGRQWVCTIDEPGGDSKPDTGGSSGDKAGARPDLLDPTHNDPRKWTLWGNLMAGGAGIEWYFGWAYTTFTTNGVTVKAGGDGQVYNYKQWETMWNQSRYAHDFFEKNLPFTQMSRANTLVPQYGSVSSNGFAYCFAKKGSIYAAYFSPTYLQNNTAKLNVETNAGNYSIQWFNPRTGGSLIGGTISNYTNVSGWILLGTPGTDLSNDWVALVKRLSATPVNVAPTVSIKSSASSVVAPGTVTLTATASDADGNLSNIKIYNGSTLLGMGTSSPFSVTATNLAVGSYTFKAVATDSGNLSSSSSVGVTVTNPNRAPSVTLSTTNLDLVAPGSVTLISTASDPDGNLSGVKFYNGSTLISDDTIAPYSVNVPNLAAGSYTFKAVAYDSLGVVSTAATVSLTIANNTPPQVQIVTPADSSSFEGPLDVGVTANATDTDGSISKVEFYVDSGAAPIQTDNLAPYQFTWSAVPVGNHTLTAKAYDNKGGTSSSSVSFVVVKPKVLYISATTTLNASDAAVKTKLENLGYDVVVESGVSSVEADATGKKLIVISSVVTSTDVGQRFRNTPVPVLTWESHLLDDLGMTGTVKGTDYMTATGQTQIYIVNSSHPLAAGLSGIVSVYGASGIMSWGLPASTAIRVGDLTTGARSGLFAYEKGVSMVGVTAPARRVFIFLEDNQSSNLTAQGQSLLDAAIKWSLGKL